jgi:hypothetical protein
MPIGPGDTVRTTAERRVEIQFDTGTIVRLDFATEFRVETILARSLSKLDELSVMALDRGRIYVMYREYDKKELFQVMTPNAAVRMKHNSVATVAVTGDGATEAQVKYGRAQVLFGPDERSLDDRTVNKGERLIVLKDHQSELAPAIDGTAFELWNNEVNAHFADLHRGLSDLPKPLQKLPPAVFYFAQAYGSRYGEWLWDDVYGYVWRPFIDNGAYPWGWQPYFYGQWARYGGQMFWVPGEPWGWIPYHLGVWHWSKKIGWVWLPGSMFAPAWATWDFYFGYACWRPWGVFDWMYGYYDPFGWSGFSYGGGSWGYAPNRRAQAGVIPPTVTRRGQLKQPEDSPFPVPGELRRILANVTAAYRRGDARVREDAEARATRLRRQARPGLPRDRDQGPHLGPGPQCRPARGRFERADHTSDRSPARGRPDLRRRRRGPLGPSEGPGSPGDRDRARRRQVLPGRPVHPVRRAGPAKRGPGLPIPGLEPRPAGRPRARRPYRIFGRAERGPLSRADVLFAG